MFRWRLLCRIDFLDLRLRCGHFCYKDPGHWNISCVGIGVAVSTTISYPETHVHLSFFDFGTMSLNVTHTVNILARSTSHHNSINRLGCLTFNTVEGKVPTFATPITASDSERTGPKDSKSCVWYDKFLLNTQSCQKKI